MKFTEMDKDFMREAIRLGALGKGSVFPNPPVGAVIVREGEILGAGYHRRWGEKHAEVLAIEDTQGKGLELQGCTMYVTLEPCCHHGKTPPCTDRIIASGISRVFISCLDEFDARVCGIGAKRLTDAGIEVSSGLLEEDGSELIEHYAIQRLQNRAFLSLKWASSLDGRIATASGDSKWISGEPARKFAHELRSMHSAVAVGYGTLIKDDPLLTVRSVESHYQPTRIVFAGGKVIPNDLRMFGDGAPIIIINQSPDQPDIETSASISNIDITTEDNFWTNLLRELPAHGIGSVLVEGGGEIITSVLREKAADRIYCVIAPMILGEGISAVNDLNIGEISGGLRLATVRKEEYGDDILITGRLER